MPQKIRTKEVFFLTFIGMRIGMRIGTCIGTCIGSLTRTCSSELLIKEYHSKIWLSNIIFSFWNKNFE